jgi:EmrB/QacA subfamily drug resistance transporter
MKKGKSSTRNAKSSTRNAKSSTRNAKSSSVSWGPLIVLCIAFFILVFDTTAMTVAINDLVIDLDTDVSTIQAIMAIYTLVMASTMLMGAKLGDMYGRKKVFIVGVAVYGVGTMLAALSPNVGVLFTGWSLIEGCAAAAMLPATMALLASSYPGTKQRATAFAILGGIGAAGAAVGPMLGGFIVSQFSWRLVFASEFILVVVILIFSGMLKEVEIDASTRPSMDIIGGIISGLSFALIILAFLNAGSGLIVPVMIVLGIILFFGFKLWTERRKRQNKTPLFDFDLFKSKTFFFGNIAQLILNMALMGTLFILPVYMQQVLDYSAMETGIYLMPYSLSILFISFVTGPISQKFNNKYLLIFGIIIAAIGTFVIQNLFSGLEIVTGSDLVIGLIIYGIGIGFVIALLTNMLISAVSDDKQNEGSGMINMVKNMGSSMGTALIGTVLVAFIFSGIATGVLTSDDIQVDMPKDELTAKLQDYAEKMAGEHAEIDQSQYTEEELNDFKKIVYSATQSAMKQSFLVIFIILVITLVFALFIPSKKKPFA